MALTLVLLLGIGGGFGSLRSDSRVYAQVPTDADAASLGLSGTFAGLADYASVSGVFAVTTSSGSMPTPWNDSLFGA